MSDKEQNPWWPWVIVVFHLVIAVGVVSVICLVDPKDSSSEQQFRLTLESKEQRIAQQADEIAKLRHQILALTANQCIPAVVSDTDEGASE